MPGSSAPGVLTAQDDPCLSAPLRKEALRPCKQWEHVVQAAGFLCEAQGGHCELGGTLPGRWPPFLFLEKVEVLTGPWSILRRSSAGPRTLQYTPLKSPPSPPNAVHSSAPRQRHRPQRLIQPLASSHWLLPCIGVHALPFPRLLGQRATNLVAQATHSGG